MLVATVVHDAAFTTSDHVIVNHTGRQADAPFGAQTNYSTDACTNRLVLRKALF